MTDDEAAHRARFERWALEQAEVSRRQRKVPRRERFSQRIANRFLDRGLDTGGHVYTPEHLEQGRIQYVPSAWHTLPRALRHTGVSHDDVFIDFGCGKGRVVHQAAKRPFRKVIGVEISPALAEAARAAIEAGKRHHRCADVEIVVADASEYRVPDDLTIAYFFHPFHGEALDAVLADIVGSIDRNPRRVSLIYCYPLRSEQIEATGRFQLVKQLRGGLRPASARLHRTFIYESR